MRTLRLGIDLGGTKIEGILLDAADPSRPLCRHRIPTEAERGYEHIVAQIATVVEFLGAKASGHLPSMIGIGTPGVTDPSTGLLRGSNTQCLNGRALRIDLEQRLQRAVVMANDANCFALAEATMGAAVGYETVFGVIVGTGCGGGLVVNGRVLRGCHGIAGEWGQLIVEPEGRVSGYGTRGTLETVISGPALEAFYLERTGAKRPLREIGDLARDRQDPDAVATITRLTDTFARALSCVIDVFDPHAIVIGGGVGNLDALYAPETRAKIAQHIFAPSFEAALLRPKLGDSAGVFGAAMLVPSAAAAP